MKNIFFFIFLSTALSFIFIGCTGVGYNKALNQNLNCKDCNVIIIGIDALRADHISAYGYSKETTPNLDEIARKSFVFRNAISASSWTLPSFMSMFTSTYPSEHGIKNIYIRNKKGGSILANIKELNPDTGTLAESLRQNNYATAAFVGGGGLHSRFGFDKGFDVYYEPGNFTGFELSIQKSLEWLGNNKNKKFFVFIHGYDIHGRYLTEKDYSGIFIDKNYKGPYTGEREEQIKIRNLSLDEGHVDLSEEDKGFWISLYDSKLYDADQRLGIFFSEIEKLNILNNSIVVVLGDHGEELFERNRTDHGFSLYDELIHVPLIIYMPNSNENILVREQVRTIDLMPTILELTEISASDNVKSQMRGKSLVPLMGGQTMDLDAFSETDYLYKVFKRSLRKSNGWKYIYSIDTNEKELYNLNKDPGEKNNLISKEPRIAYELEQELFSYMYRS